MSYKILNRSYKRLDGQVIETTVDLRQNDPYTLLTRKVDGDHTNTSDKKLIEIVLQIVNEETTPMSEIKSDIKGLKHQFENQEKEVSQTKEKVVKLDGNLNKEAEKTIALEQSLNKEIEKINKLVETIIHAEDLTASQKELILAQYPVYEVGQQYAVSDVINYGGELYEVVQQHKSQEDWNPTDTPALYTPVNNTVVEDEEGNEIEVITDFVQPQGAHDAYHTGEKVRFNGEVYDSTMDNNIYSPQDYAQGWKVADELIGATPIEDIAQPIEGEEDEEVVE